MNQPDTVPSSRPATYPDEFFLKTLLRWYIGLIIRPASTIREIVDARPLGLGLLTLVVTNAVVSMLNVTALVDGVSVGIVVGAGIFFAMFAIPTHALPALVSHSIAKMLDGNGTYVGYLSAVSMATIILLAASVVSEIPWIILSNSETATILTSVIVALAGLIWFAVPWIVVLRENYGFTTGNAIGAALIAFLPSAMVFLMLSLLWGSLFFAWLSLA